jgi:hypothetical protein
MTAKTTKKPIHLYWLTVPSEVGAEDWFIFARTARSAAGFHERYEDFDTKTARAERILTNIQLAKLEHGDPPCHAQLVDLKALGFEILGDDPLQRVVRLNGRTFVEGYMEAEVETAVINLLEASGKGRLNGIRRRGSIQ